MRDAESRFASSTRPVGARRPALVGSRADRLFSVEADGSGAPAIRPAHIATLALVICGALALTILLGSSSADAATINKPAGTFQLQSVDGPTAGAIAVDEETGSVYVMDGACCTNNRDIEKFDAAGNKSNFSSLGTNVINTTCEESCMQIAVDNSGGPNQGVIYVSSANQVVFGGGIEVYLPTGEFVGKITVRSQFEYGVAACGVDVDENGDVIAAHGEFSTSFTYIDRLGVPDWSADPNAQPVVKETLAPDAAALCRTRIDPEGNVYAINGTSGFNSGSVRRYEAESFATGVNPIGKEVPAEAAQPATVVDPGSAYGLETDDEGQLYVYRSDPPRIRKYDSSGSLIETFGSGELMDAGNSSIAVNSAAGKVYVGDGSFEPTAKDVHIYDQVIVPDSLTGDFTAATAFTGSLDGEVDPASADPVTDCQFEYTTNQKYLEKEFTDAALAPCDPAAPFGEPKDVSADISGLTLEEPYVFRLRSNNLNGASNGTIHRFIPHAVIGLETDPATSVGARTAILHASFLGTGDDTEYFFEYGKNLGYGATTPAQVSQAPNGVTTVSAPVSGLDLETLYNFRVVAENSVGKSVAENQTFTTTPAVLGVQTKAATGIGQGGITLNGEFVGDGQDVDYYFEYGLDTDYGMVSDTTEASAPNGPTTVSTVIDQFQGYSTYHYRLVAENALGKTFGPDLTFSTPAAPLPGVASTQVSDVTSTGATFTSSVNPNRWPTVYLFEWGPTTAYGSSTGFTEVLGGLNADDRPVAATVGGLAPGTLYHVRTVAINLTGTTNGPDQTFVTPGPPQVESASASNVGQTSAHLGALVSAAGSPTSIRFEYGQTEAYGSSTAPVAIGSDLFAQAAGADIGGLAPGTVYHARAVATNAVGTTSGADFTFTTVAPPPIKPPEGKRAKPCPKGKVKRKGKCVKKPKKKKQKGKKGKRGQRNG